ncbi:hypothetical protein JCGZ_25141 [Jatropha curcas]|uniref:Uncharacterized protein n=1 Tax=Jatropha curcas TaxID=180498 RepID=A0A067L5K3_JATCU|nr:hypothetical protein JCGZ_25141 [Jatropha curcas]
MHFPTPVSLYVINWSSAVTFMHHNPFNSGPFLVRIDPPREITSRAWRRRPGQRFVRVSPNPEPAPVSPVVSPSSPVAVADSDLVEMADGEVNGTGFSSAQIRAITEIITAVLAQERAQNQVPPASRKERFRNLLQASGGFQSRGKMYPGLEIFMTEYEEQLIKSPEPTFEQLVDGTQFMVGMVQTGSGSDWSQKILEF